MDFTEVAKRLEIEWDTHGFFDHVRRGRFDREKAQELLAILRTLDFNAPLKMGKAEWFFACRKELRQKVLDGVGNGRLTSTANKKFY